MSRIWPALSAVVLLAAAASASAELKVVRMWFPTGQAVRVTNDAPAAVRLALMPFAGGEAIRARDGRAATVPPGGAADLDELFGPLPPGIYRLSPLDAADDSPAATPLVIDVRGRSLPRPEASVTKVTPLQYAVVETDAGDVTVAFYYGVAPNTVANFVALAAGGFYDGLQFHRVVPGFVIQGGDPRNDTTGGPGYRVPGEFNDRPFLAGVVGMARRADPIEGGGAMPRPEAADSAGSQFFIALDHDATAALDGRYAAFGRVVAGMDAVGKIAAGPVADKASGRPERPVVIRRVRIKTVTPGDDPYKTLAALEAATSRPTTQPASEPAAP